MDEKIGILLGANSLLLSQPRAVLNNRSSLVGMDIPLFSSFSCAKIYYVLRVFLLAKYALTIRKVSKPQRDSR